MKLNVSVLVSAWAGRMLASEAEIGAYLKMLMGQPPTADEWRHNAYLSRVQDRMQALGHDILMKRALDQCPPISIPSVGLLADD